MSHDGYTSTTDICRKIVSADIDIRHCDVVIVLVSCLTIVYLPIFKQNQAAMANQSMEIIAKVLEQSAKLVEEQVDAQLAKLNEMDEDDLERLKERRLEALKKAQKQKQVCGTIYNHCSILLC